MSNTRTSATLGEILTAKFLNGNKFCSQESRQKYFECVQKSDNNLLHEQKCKSRFITYFIKNNYCNKYKSVKWVGGGSGSYDKKEPYDIILNYRNKKHGISLKTTKSRNSIIGNYSFDKFTRLIGVHYLNDFHNDFIYNKLPEYIPELRNITLSERDALLKENENLRKKVYPFSQKFVKKIKNRIVNRLNEIKDTELIKEIILNYFLNKTGYQEQEYSIVECRGEGGDYQIVQDLVYPRYEKIEYGRLFFESRENTQVNVHVDDEILFKFYLKYKKRKMSGALNIKVELCDI